MDWPPRSHKGSVVLSIVIVVLVAIGTFVYLDIRSHSIPLPDFPSLTDDPDPRLHGTVAYLDQTTYCVTLVSASGAASRQVYCFAGKLEGEGGPALAWLPDGRLEMIMYDWSPGEPARTRWRKIVDVTTLAVEDASLEGVPPEFVRLSAPARMPDGRTIVTESYENGTISILIDEPTGLRPLMNASGGVDYAIMVDYPIWSPDFAWLLVIDERLLVVTLEDPVTTRILVAEPVVFRGSGIPAVAITSQDLLAGE